MNNYGTTYSANQTASSGWWWFLLIVAIVVVGILIYLAIKKRLLYKYQLEKTKDWLMLKISIPKERVVEQTEERLDFREMAGVIEPFFSNLEALFDPKLGKKIVGQDHISVEIISKKGLVSFYIGTPVALKESIEKSILSQYPDAIVEVDETREFSIFKNIKGEIAASNLRLLKKFFFPIKTYRHLEYDPLNGIVNAMSRLGENCNVGIQILIRPTDNTWRFAVEKAAKGIQAGKSSQYYNTSANQRVSESFFTFAGNVGKVAVGKSLVDEEKDKLAQNQFRQNPLQEQQLKLLAEKSGKTGFDCQIRVLSVAPTKEKAKETLSVITSAFSQFFTPENNGFKPKKAKRQRETVANYIYRIYGREPRLLLNTEELASIYHLPNRFTETPNIAWVYSKKESPPPALPTEGVIVGETSYRGQVLPIRIKDADRMRHIYMVGKTGVGKTVLYQNLILQDIKNGKGVAYLDPNGDAIEYILAHIPKERADDVIIFDPSDTERPMGLNLLEWKTNEQRDFLVQEAIQIFYKLFDPNQTGIVGPQFEHWMRNGALTLMAHPDGGTLVDLPRLFTDPDFEKERTKYVTDPVVRSFWEKQMTKTSDFHKSEMLNYFTSKFGRFMTNDMMRNIIGQSKSAFDFREVMDGKKILLCKLSKGLIGEINAFLLGMIIVSKIAMGAFSRQDVPEAERTPFYLYVDEFQNFITDVFATILSESRKYKLSLAITNQYIAQLDEKIRDAVIGNAGNLISFRIGAADAEFLVKEFSPLTLDDLTNVDKFNFYIRELIDNAPMPAFNGQSIPPDETGGDGKLAEAIRQLSRLKYGRAKEVVEEEISDRSQIDKIDLPGIGEGNRTGPNG
ncbi:MAG: type IV secretion system DNA-binding domain-containing protein [Candidatus Berkelbacteria bacterium]|nr:type IV secretion system DNA-binding domain-containing protein [Candidatus Berkelbacteria bacterium]